MSGGSGGTRRGLRSSRVSLCARPKWGEREEGERTCRVRPDDLCERDTGKCESSLGDESAHAGERAVGDERERGRWSRVVLARRRRRHGGFKVVRGAGREQRGALEVAVQAGRVGRGGHDERERFGRRVEAKAKSCARSRPSGGGLPSSGPACARLQSPCLTRANQLVRSAPVGRHTSQTSLLRPHRLSKSIMREEGEHRR